MSLSQRTAIDKRIFVTGASRSGTTLLQSLLAGHSNIYTFPETGVFLKILGMRRRTPWALAGLSLGREKKTLQKLCNSLQPAADSRMHIDSCLTLKSSAEQIVDFLDRLTLDQGKAIWVEKTPRHFKYADILLRYIPRSHVLHILRDGRDVVTSIYLRAMRHPEKFDKQLNLHYGIRLWNEAVRKAHSLLDMPGHSTLIYEDLTRHPERTLHALCAEMDMDFEPEMLRMPHGAYFVKDNESWKQNTDTEVVTNTSKFASVFDKPTRDWIEDKLHLDLYHQLRCSAADRLGHEEPSMTTTVQKTI